MIQQPVVIGVDDPMRARVTLMAAGRRAVDGTLDRSPAPTPDTGDGPPAE